MSGSIDTSLSNFGLVGRVATESQLVSSKLDTLTEQVSSGLIATSYAGLGSGASVSLNLNPQVAALQTQQNDISAATGKLGVTQAALAQIQQIATNFVAKLPTLNSLAPLNIDTVAADARDALKQVANLLNTQDGGVYVFGGQDSSKSAGAGG